MPPSRKKSLGYDEILQVHLKSPNSKTFQKQQQQKRSYLAYRFADGIEYVVPEVRETFSCVNRDYGYYADIGNNCQVFHVCVPPAQQFSFFCPNTTIFDQRLLICQDQYAATPCQDAERFYVVNSNFGVTDEEKIVRVWKKL